MKLIWIIGTFSLFLRQSDSINRLSDAHIPVMYPHGSHHSHAVGMLRHDSNHHHPRFVNFMELMDPLESRKIDPMPSQSELMDEVNYLRSYAVEECRQLVCSTEGKKRFSACAASLLSAEKQCKPDCEDHLQMWVIHRCYLIETFDCDGNIGPKSVADNTLIFNQEGPQTLTEFTASIQDLFGSKGITCNCCDYSNIVLVKDTLLSATPLFIAALVIVLISALI